MEMGATFVATTIRVFSLELSNNRILILEDCLYVLEVRRNLISISKLGLSGYSFLFNSKLVIKFQNKFVASGIIYEGLYLLNVDNSLNNIENDDSSVLSLKRKRDVNPTYLWHLKAWSCQY